MGGRAHAEVRRGRLTASTCRVPSSGATGRRAPEFTSLSDAPRGPRPSPVPDNQARRRTRCTTPEAPGPGAAGRWRRAGSGRCGPRSSGPSPGRRGREGWSPQFHTVTISPSLVTMVWGSILNSVSVTATASAEPPALRAATPPTPAHPARATPAQHRWPRLRPAPLFSSLSRRRPTCNPLEHQDAITAQMTLKSPTQLWIMSSFWWAWRRGTAQGGPRRTR
jgi:hypothetical protein